MIADETPVLVHNCKTWKNENDPHYPDRNVVTRHQPEIPEQVPVRSSRDKSGDLADGTHTYVIMPDGEVRSYADADAEDWYGAEFFGHTSLAGRDAGGKPNAVLLAGKFTVRNGRITRADNNSGHYMPQPYGDKMLQKIAKRAFTEAGYSGRRLIFQALSRHE